MEENFLVPVDPPPVFEGFAVASEQHGRTSVVQEDGRKFGSLKQLQTSNA